MVVEGISIALNENGWNPHGTACRSGHKGALPLPPHIPWPRHGQSQWVLLQLLLAKFFCASPSVPLLGAPSLFVFLRDVQSFYSSARLICCLPISSRICAGIVSLAPTGFVQRAGFVYRTMETALLIAYICAT